MAIGCVVMNFFKKFKATLRAGGLDVDTAETPLEVEISQEGR